ncbi:MAG TPA: phosphotransferase [Bacteroidia bacterium]|nr:phosphotransferase [Bacteroidia bacterium]HQK96637.1 phosphotransferase [Bacteroidia bacterium]
MNRNPIYLTDLLLLRDLFAKHHTLLIIDPLHRLIGECTGDAVVLEKRPEAGFDEAFVAELNDIHQLSFYLKNNTAISFSEMAYINNPDGTIRWFFPLTKGVPGHLSLYNSVSLKAKIYKWVSTVAGRLGQTRLLASGIIRMQQNLLDQVKTVNDITPEEDISFFTGTRGATRKVVMEIHNKETTVAFVKIPVTPVSEELVKTETEMLKELNKYDFTTLSLPKVSRKIDGHARLSNVKPGITIPADRITAIHIKALAELYALSHERKAISDSTAWETISANMEWLKRDLLFTNGLDSKSTGNLVKLLRKLYNTFSAGESISLSVSHGDFTPWNMYCDEQRLYVYDWEMSRNGIPMFFDLFHFTYQSTILQQRKDYSTVKSSINLWKQQPLVQQMLQKYKINLALHEKLYLLFTVSYYLRQYLNEKELLQQSHWMIKAWTEAITDQLETVSNTSH